MYKRIASAASQEELKELQVEMIDRFGLLPEPTRNLFAVTTLKLRVQPLGIRKIEAGPAGGRILFGEEPKVDPLRIVRLVQARPNELKLDGGDKLRFFGEMHDPTKRVSQVAGVVEQLIA